MNLQQSYDNFKSTILECGSYLIDSTTDDIEFKLFEEFSVDVVTFLHEKNLSFLAENGYIDSKIYELSKKLRSDYLSLEHNHPEYLNAPSVRTCLEWRKILFLSDAIAKLLYL